MKNLNFYEVFISSPSDLQDERKMIKEFIDNYKFNKDVRLSGVLWEKDLPATSGVSPQELINRNLLPNADILIGLFSTRFGSSTENSESGTVEEIELFINSGKPVILYFIKDKKSKAASDLVLEDVRNLEKILLFKQKYENKGIYKEITLSELQQNLQKDLEFNLNELLSNNIQHNAYNIIGMNKINDINMVEKKNIPCDELPENKDVKYRGNWWADDSITKFINEYLMNKGFGAKYKADITFNENLQFIKGSSGYTEETTTQILKSAKEYAFNKKYGNFEYGKDLRDKYNSWSKKIKERIQKFFDDDLNTKKILGIGSNYGKELEDIFGKNMLKHCTVLDISNDAISKGKKIYPDMEFVKGDMESPYLVNTKFDICVCLRTIQSRGAFRQNVIIQMDRALAKNGLMLISIPNGYIDETNSNTIVRGLYDHRIQDIQKRRPEQLACKIWNKLIDYGYENVGMETLDTEVLIWGVKNDRT